MKRYFAGKKDEISRYLDEFEAGHREDYGGISFLGKDVLGRLVDFAKQGKMLRGGLVGLASELSGGSAGKDCIILGASLELFQSALLIHDDIMDRDTLRRGSPSLYHQYALLSEKWNLADPEHTGASLGICAGDIAFFTAFELLSRTGLEETVKSQIIRLCSRELSYVGIAQMVDVYNGADPETPAPEDVLHLYTYKTGRYTFSLPLMIGGIAAGQPPEIIKIFEEVGAALGTVFQLKDDELGIFGDEKALGKPVGSDIREGKKTLLYIYLFEQVNGSTRKKLQSIFGNAHASDDDIEFVKSEMIGMGLNRQVSGIASDFINRAREGVERIPGANGAAKRILEELIDYSTERVR